MLKIHDLRITRFAMTRLDPAWRTASYAASTVDGFVIELIADGMVGIGATAAHPNSISAAQLNAQLTGPIRDVVVGADALCGNEIRRALATTKTHPRARIAADLALYDLVAKFANLPCYSLWGGAVRPNLKVVRMIGIKPPADLVASVRDLHAAGYGHFKIKIGTGIAEDVERIRAVREAFGPDIWLAVDGNSAYMPSEAIDLSRALRAYEVALIEQPVHYKDVKGLAQLTAASPIPIMADQCVNDAKSALAVCRAKAAHIVSIKATSLGSVDECWRVYEICRAFDIRVHLGGSVTSALTDMAQAHLAATLPEIEEECEVGEFMAVRGDPIQGAVIENGRMQLNHEPGWGVKLDPEFGKEKEIP
jgi:L-alanine-DL-glutamate epimerase-like enolase superfamily enzyme